MTSQSRKRYYLVEGTIKGSRFRSGMIWLIANKQIIELITTTDFEKIQELSVEILDLTKVSWLDVLRAIGDIEHTYNRKIH